ncbi:MAG: vitamin K epoxide reductase family protein [Chloroflexi bacterium]|nr:vitamin K epoxide reductase family protein [Chloroflexota bacterium]
MAVAWKGRIRRWGIPILTALGMGISGYLLAIDLTGDPALCLGSADCEVVSTSPYARIMGVPVALLGLGLYAILLVISLAPSRLPQPLPLYSLLAIYGLSLAGVLFSAYLTYIEVFVLRAICPWCVASAVDLALIWGLATWLAPKPT